MSLPVTKVYQIGGSENRKVSSHHFWKKAYAPWIAYGSKSKICQKEVRINRYVFYYFLYY